VVERQIGLRHAVAEQQMARVVGYQRPTPYSRLKVIRTTSTGGDYEMAVGLQRRDGELAHHPVRLGNASAATYPREL
jgi:hypothetical protein